MPGNVQLATVTSVLPFSLSTAFTRQSKWEFVANFFSDGRNLRRSLVSSPRNTWVLSKRLTPALMGQLRTFWNQQQGGTVPFFYYDPYESNFTYDPTGSLTTGRYSVRFQGELKVTGSIPRVTVPLQLVEIV